MLPRADINITPLIDILLVLLVIYSLRHETIERLGGRKRIKVDIRLIAATNRNLWQAVADGCFREDLYFRLNVLGIRTPPLRDRLEDVPALALHFISRFQNKTARTVHRITEEALWVLRQYHWPGNVRELRNVIQRAIAMGSSDLIEPQDLPGVFEFPEEMTMDKAIKDLKRQYVIKAVLAANGNRKKAAEILNIRPKSLPRILKSHGLLGFDGFAE